MVKQYIYQDGNEYFLIDVYKDTIDGDVVTLKVKRNGWSDIWSLPLQLIKETDNG
jgi:hypothetical protein